MRRPDVSRRGVESSEEAEVTAGTYATRRPGEERPVRRVEPDAGCEMRAARCETQDAWLKALCFVRRSTHALAEAGAALL